MTTTPIAEQAAALGAQMAEQVPAEVLAPFTEEREHLVDAGIPSAVAEPGTTMPDGELLDAHGAATSLASALGGKPGVIVFYRGAWCPYCNIALRTYEADLVDELAKRGASLVAISPQTPDGSLTITETNQLTFTVLSDPGNQIGGALGILTEPSDGAKASQAALGLDVAATNADGTAIIPMPTTVIVDQAGRIRWIDVHPEYTTRSEPVAILNAYDEVI